jgi:phenylalanyl-tRNA synthetase alpha chain
MYQVPKLTDYSDASLLRALVEFRISAILEWYQVVEKMFDPKLGAPVRQSELKRFRDRWLGRKDGLFTHVNEIWLKAAPADRKRAVGQIVNEIKRLDVPAIENLEGRWELVARQSSGAIQAINRMSDGTKSDELREKQQVHAAGLRSLLAHLRDLTLPEIHAESAKLQLGELIGVFPLQPEVTLDRLDITLPGIRRPLGAEHPVIRTMNEIVAVFRNLGYSVSEGPEIESDYYNFESLNFPPNHPARDMQDTLFIADQDKKAPRDRLLLRTHTSPVQIRTMEKMKPPLRIVIPGKVYRNDPPDASHSPMFHQIEGLAVDTNITFGDLKGTLDHAMKALFGSTVKTQFRPSFFPFTEPSAEMMVSCFICGGSGKRGSEPCRPCKMTGWIEILGCGMVDPNVFEFVKHNGYDSKKVSGFAFGMGADRIAILKYGVDDIQLFFQGDVRFLEQFK